MKSLPLLALIGTGIAALVPGLAGQTASPAHPYRVVQSARVGGGGDFDYIFADSDHRNLYIPRGNRIDVFNLDTLASAGEIKNVNNVHGVAVDSGSGHGFSSSQPLVMWDVETLSTIKTIPVQGNPDGILFDPASSHVLVLSHRAPNITFIDSKDGTIVGTADIGGAPEQAVSDNAGLIYVDVEDQDNVAVLDAKTQQVIKHYSLGGKAKTPAGLAFDAANLILFVFCRNPALCVILNAATGALIDTLPIGEGTDGAAFNPTTMEAFSSQRDGTLTIVHEISPTSFEVAQNVLVKAGAKTCTLDLKTDRIFLIAAEYLPPPTPPKPTSPAPAPTPPWRNRGEMVPDSFSIFVVGK
jgi:DNA-binding beta-propeller fold protein YncE